MPTASANPPSVMVLSVCPVQYMTSSAATMERGMDARMMSVSRQFPRKQQYHDGSQSRRHRPAHQQRR